LAGWIRDDYKTLGIELGTAMIDLGIDLKIKDEKLYMNYDFIGFWNQFNETDKGSLNLHEQVEEAIEYISKNFDDYSKNVLVYHLKSLAQGEENKLRLPQVKYLYQLMDKWDLSSEFFQLIEDSKEYDTTMSPEAEEYLKNLEKKDDPVSLKEESDKTPKTEKQIASEDQVADSATVETDDKMKTEKETAEKKVPIWKLIQQTIESMDGKAEKKEIINHLLGEHSHLKKNTLQCQVTICTVNNPSRINWAQNKKPRTERNQYDFLYQTDKKTVVMYDPKAHGKWGIVEDKDGKLMITKLAN
jgi:hypothetical protein